MAYILMAYILMGHNTQPAQSSLRVSREGKLEELQRLQLFDSERVEVPECGSGQMAEILGQIVPPTTQAHAAIYSGMLKFTEISAHTEIH